MPKLPTGTVTFLFTDIQGSTPLWESQPEQMAQALQVHNTALRGVIEAQGSAVFKTVGDEFQVAFPTAPQALKAAIAGQRALASALWNDLGELKVRMGLHTGEAEIDLDGDEYAVSHTKNRVARIMSAAHGGQVLLSQETKDLVDHQLPEDVTLKDLGEHRLKGMGILEHLYQACVPLLPQEFPPLATAITILNNLPVQLTSFIGREQETAQVVALLEKHRLVTLTGSGGVGKTRLSIQVAGDVLNQFPDGVWYVELAPISDPELVAQTTAGVLGLREEPTRPILETMISFLSKRKLLLVVDNCEHLLEACAAMADALLRRAPGIKLLVSSREALGVAGEHAYRVPSLGIPDPNHLPPPSELMAYSSVQLLVERARAVLPGFEITARNAPSVAAVCQRLDGIPLALELAAARLNLLTTEQLASRLDHAFRLLTGGSRTALPRQQTLRATVDWSYQLLAEAERVLLRRLAVFAGGCTLEAAEAVCAGDDLEAEAILDLLGGLVSKSMVDVERQQGEETRYRLLETVRQYAREKLFDSGESEALRGRHLDHFVEFCEQAYPQIHGAGRLEWTKRLQQDYDNIREAMEWAFHDPSLAEAGMRIAVTLPDRFWMTQGYYQEGARWLRAGLQAGGEGLPRFLQAQAYYGLSRMYLGEEEKSGGKAVQLCREIGPEVDAVLCLALCSSSVPWLNPNHLTRLDEALQIARRLGAVGTWQLGEVLFFYAFYHICDPQGRYDDRAFAAAEEMLRVIEYGDSWNASGHWTMAIIKEWRGESEQARRHLETALELFREVDDIMGIRWTLFLLARFHRRAARFELAHWAYREMGWVSKEKGYQAFPYFLSYAKAKVLVDELLHPSISWDADLAVQAVSLFACSIGFKDQFAWWQRFIDMDLERLTKLRTRMGAAAYLQAWEKGAAMSLEQAVALVVEV